METKPTTHGDTMLAVIIEDTTNSVDYFARTTDGGFDFQTDAAVAALADANEENPNIYFHAVEVPADFQIKVGAANFHKVKKAVGKAGRTWEDIARWSY